MNRLTQEMSPLPADAWRSITFDRGLEFLAWRELATGMGTKTWVCDPQAPWQKRTVEKMNKRVCRHLPGDIVLLELPQQAIALMARRLNATPRKGLGHRTPAKAFRGESLKLETP